MSSYQYRKCHCGDKTILWPSYLHNVISYTGKTTYLYWIRAQFTDALAGTEQTVNGHYFLKAFITPWWRHQMETFSALLAIWAGDSPVPGEFHAQRPVTRSFDVFFDLRLNKQLSKQSWGWWFEMLSCPLWRHSNAKCCKVYTDNTNIETVLTGFINTDAFNMFINLFYRQKLSFITKNNDKIKLGW